MYTDEIIEEVWKNRQVYQQEHGNDLDAMVKDLMRRQSMHPEKLVDRTKTLPTKEQAEKPKS